MPETSAVQRLVLAMIAGLSLNGCVYATAGVETFRISSEPAVPPIVEDTRLSPTEIAYTRDTARVLFKRRDGERTARFVSADANEGYALCLRAGGDYALLVFQRRIYETAISQAADDAVILRSDRETAACRGAVEWVRI